MLGSFLVLLVCSVLNAHAGLLPIKSGNFQEMDDPCQQYSLCGSRGFTYWQDLTKTLGIPHPMDKPDDFEIYKNWYRYTLVDHSGGGQQIQEDLIHRGFSPIDNYKMWHVSSLQSKTGQADEETSYENMFNAEDGVIIATYNWRPLDSQKKLQWYSTVFPTETIILLMYFFARSDIVYHTYRLNLKPGQSMRSLKAVIQVDITNPGTFRILQSAYKARGLDANHDRYWRRWTPADSPYFYWFLGTDNVKGTMFLLKDHASAIGKKVITAIWTRAEPSFDIWIQLGPYHPTMEKVATT